MQTFLETIKRNEFLNRNVEQYKTFMIIDTLPIFNVFTFEISLDESTQKGYGVLASYLYDVDI